MIVQYSQPNQVSRKGEEEKKEGGKKNTSFHGIEDVRKVETGGKSGIIPFSSVITFCF
jgi:hypothetical protein